MQKNEKKQAFFLESFDSQESYSRTKVKDFPKLPFTFESDNWQILFFAVKKLFGREKHQLSNRRYIFHFLIFPTFKPIFEKLVYTFIFFNRKKMILRKHACFRRSGLLIFQKASVFQRKWNKIEKKSYFREKSLQSSQCISLIKKQL